MREEEVSQMRQEISKQTKTRETVQKKFWQMEEQKADVEVQMEVLKAQTAALEKGKGLSFKGMFGGGVGGAGLPFGAIISVSRFL